MITSRFTIGIVAIMFSAATALAEEDQRTLPEKQAQTYIRLLQLRTDHKARKTFERKPEQKAAIADEWKKALKSADWTQEKFDAVNGEVDTILVALHDLGKGGEDAEAAKSTLDEANKTTVATVKANRKAIEAAQDSDAAEKAYRAKKDAERLGDVPDPAKIAGTWKLDIDATIEAMLGELGEAAKAEMRTKMEKDFPKSTYTFGPGNAIVAVNEVTKDGKTTTSTEKGTFRIEGHKLFLKPENRKREMELTIGMKGDVLRLGLGKLPSSGFKKAQ